MPKTKKLSCQSKIPRSHKLKGIFEFRTTSVHTHKKNFLMTAPCKGLFSAILHTLNYIKGLKTPTGRKAEQKAIYTNSP